MSSRDSTRSSGGSPEPCFATWGVEIVFLEEDKKSAMHSAKRLIMDHEYIQIQLPDGKYIAYPLSTVRKVLSMRTINSLRHVPLQAEDSE